MAENRGRVGEGVDGGEDAAVWMRYEGGRVWHIARPRPFGSTFVTMRPICGFSGERIATVLADPPFESPAYVPCKGCTKASHTARTAGQEVKP